MFIVCWGFTSHKHSKIIYAKQEPVCLLRLYIQATSKVILWALICDSAHPWRRFKAAPLEYQATGVMIQYPTLSHYPDTELTSPYPNNTRYHARCDKYQIIKLLVWLDPDSNSRLSLLSRPHCGRLYGGVVRRSDLFPSRSPNLKISGSIPHAITPAILDLHHCV